MIVQPSRLLEDVRKIVCTSEVSDFSRLAEIVDRIYKVRDSAAMAPIERVKQLAQLDVICKNLDAIR